MKNILSIPEVKELKVIFLKVNDKSEEFTISNVFKDGTIKTLKHKIFCETDVKPNSQYLYISTPLDEYFFEMVELMFRNRNILTNKNINSQMNKILSDKDFKKFRELKKSKLNIDELLDFIKENVKSYLKPLNLIFRNGIEHIDLKNFNQITDSFSENCDNKSISNYNIEDDVIYLYSKKDLIQNFEHSNKDALLEKYFQGNDTGVQKSKICDRLEKQEEELLQIYDLSKVEEEFQDEYKVKFNEIVSNKISSISILINNFFYQDCDIQRVFNMLELDEELVFSKFSVKRSKQFYKIYKPMFFGKTASITRNQFNSWKMFDLSENEKQSFKSKSIIYFKLKYNDDYATIHINSNNQILVKLESEDINLDLLKDILFKFIEKLKVIDDETFDLLQEKDFLNSNMYKIMEISLNKNLFVEKNISTNTLRKLLEQNTNYIFSLDYPQSKRISYGYKRTDNFKIDKNINYMLEKIFIKQKEKNVSEAKKYIEKVFDMESIDDKFTNFMENYTDETKNRYQLEMPHFNIVSKEGVYNIKISNFNNFDELNIVNHILDNIFQKFMLEKEGKGKRNDIEDNMSNQGSVNNIEDSNDESSNEESNSSSNENSNSDGQKVVGLNSNSNSNNSKASLSKSLSNSLSNSNSEVSGDNIQSLDTPFEFEKKNYTSYMKTMRNYYNKELFDNKDYTKKCRRQPYIVSKRHFNRNINRENKYNILRGLDTKVIDNDGNAKDIKNYFLESSNKKDIYICPRIWCAQDNLPIDPVYFAKYKKCPVCGGGVIGKTGKMTKDKCVIIVKAENDYYKSDGTVKKNYLKHILGKTPVPKELEDVELGMYPKFLDVKKDSSNKGLPCCYKGPSVDKEIEDNKTVKENVKDTTEASTFVFLTDSKFPVKKDNKIALLPKQLDILFDNKETKKILEKLENLSSKESDEYRSLKKKEAKLTEKQIARLNYLEIKKNGYQYIFKFLGKTETKGFKKELKKVEKKTGDFFNFAENLFRLTVGDEKNKSFTNAIEKLYNLSSEKQKYINDLIEDEKIFTPLLFITLNNGNLVELFKSEIEDMDDYEKWLEKHKDSLSKINITGDSQLKNIYSSFTNFKNYHFSDGVKDYNIYQDLVGRKGFLFDEDLNILIVEINENENNENVNLVCPQNLLGIEYFNQENNTIILITQKKSRSKRDMKKDFNNIFIFEPVISVRFLDIKTNIEERQALNPIYKFSISEPTKNECYRPVISSLINLARSKCNEVKENISNEIFENNLDNLFEIEQRLSEVKIKKYILGYGTKIQGLLFENKLYLPVFPSGIRNNIVDKLENIEYVNKDLLSKDEYETKLDELISVDNHFKSYKIKMLITEENESKKIKGALLKNGTIIPLKEENIDKQIKTLDYNEYFELNLDIDIYNKKEIDNKRIKFNYDYNNENYQFQKVRYLFNDYIRNQKQEKNREALKKIIINPVVPLSVKRQSVKDIVEDAFNELFHFGKITDKPDLFKNKTKKILKCYNLTKKKCNEECIYSKDKCLTFITNKNMVTGEDNKIKYIKQIIEELVRDSKKGINFITKKIDNITEIDFTNKKNEMIFGEDLFESLERKLRKRGNKFMRDIKLFNTIEQKNNVKVSKEEWGELKEGGKIKDIKRTKVVKAPSTERIYGSRVNIFGVKTNEDNIKVKDGPCIFPFKIRKQKEEKTSDILNDCVPNLPIEKKKTGQIQGADGVFCPTRAEGIYEKHRNPDGSHKFWDKKTKKNEAHYKYFENNNETPKGYCNMEEFIKRQRGKILKGKRINPNCKKTFKRKGYSKLVPTNFSNDNGDRYTCILENNPRKIKNKYEAQLICPVELDGNTYDYRKHKTEDCFV